MKYVFAGLMVLASIRVGAQYYGGDADGFSFKAVHRSVAAQEAYCSGGDADGFDKINYAGFAYPYTIVFAGGDNDGFDEVTYEGFAYNNASLYAGGVNDGFDQQHFKGGLNTQLFYCMGDDNDGFDFVSSGGEYIGFGIWNGAANRNWFNPNNWSHNTVPGTGTSVTIPAGSPRYPLLSDTLYVNTQNGLITCSRLDILPGAEIRTNSGLVVSGIMNVFGDYVSINSIDNINRIYNGGVVTIDSAGNFIIGNQNTAPALSDLVIDSAGTFNLVNGLVNIDDQLNLMSGGTLLMADGVLFLHKYGEGSELGVNGYSPFYVEAGAAGIISGGSVRLCGKPGANGLESVQINEPSFAFTSASQVVIRQGTSDNHYDCGISVVDGAQLNRLRILKAGNNVTVNSNLTIRDYMIVVAGCALEVTPGKSVTIIP